MAASKQNRFVPKKSPDIHDEAHEYRKADYINGVTLNDGTNGAAGSLSTPPADATNDSITMGAYNVKGQKSVGQGNYVPYERTGVDRSVFVIKDIINVYPDTIA